MNSGGAADIARVRNAELIHREMERALGVARYPNWPRERSLAGHLYVNAIAAHDLVALRDARSELERAGVKVSPWRYWIDELKARRPFVYRVSRLWPDSIQAVRHLIRYRPV